MSDPYSYIATKLASAIGGLFGGAGMMSFIKPKSIGEAFARGGISTGSAIIFADPTLIFLGVANNWELQLMSGGIIGFLSYSILGAVAKFFDNNRNEDIVALINKAKGKRK
jgi:hypothetical protein